MTARASADRGIDAVRWLLRLAILLAGAVATGAAFAAPPTPQVLSGFAIEIWADDLPGARSLAFAPDGNGAGTVFVGTRSDKVYSVPVRGEGRAGPSAVIARGLNQPNGVAVKDGALYVAEIDRISRIPLPVTGVGTAQTVRADLPKETHHGWRYLAFGPDGMLYVAIGAPCNVCEPEHFTRDGADLEYGSLTRMNADGSGWETVARGVRNSVGWDWQPDTRKLYFTDNGRDLLGDDLPSDELNLSTKAGEHFGFPYCHQGDTPDPDFGTGHPCSGYTPPVHKLGAHVAALGLRFYRGTQFPADYRGAALIAEHGSWNRSKKVGYRVVAVRLDGKSPRETVLVDGWLDGERASGRPVDLLTLPDGSVLISDDAGGRIWRLRYTG